MKRKFSYKRFMIITGLSLFILSARFSTEKVGNIVITFSIYLLLILILMCISLLFYDYLFPEVKTK